MIVPISTSGPRRYEWVGGIKNAEQGHFKSASRWMNTRDLAAAATAGAAASIGTGGGGTGGGGGAGGVTGKPKSSLLDVMREELLDMTGHDILQ